MEVIQLFLQIRVCIKRRRVSVFLSLYIRIYAHLICTENGYCTFLRQAEQANPKSLYSARTDAERNSRLLQTCPPYLLIVQIKYING